MKVSGWRMADRSLSFVALEKAVLTRLNGWLRMRGCVGCFLLIVVLAIGGCTSLGQKKNPKRDRLEQRANMRRDKPTETVSYDLDDPESIEPVPVLSINNERITTSDVLAPVLPDLMERSKKMPPDMYRAYLQQAVDARVRQLAREALVHQEAVKHLTDQESAYLDALVDDRIRERINVEFGGRQTRFEQMLADLDMTMEDARGLVRREIMIIRYLQMNVRPRIEEPTRGELWALYERERAEQQKPERRDMRMIEVTIDSASPEAREEAMAKIAEAKQALADGVEFATVAKKYSTGLNASLGGEWGWVTKGSVRERYEPAVEALFALEETNVASDVVETDDALFLVMATNIDSGSAPSFEDLQPRLLQRFRDEQFDMLVNKDIRELQEKALIRPQNIARFLRAVVDAAPQPSTSMP